MKNLITLNRRTSIAVWTVLLSVLLLSCSDPSEEEFAPGETGDQVTMEIPQNYSLPDFSNVDFRLPQVPDYFADEEDDESYVNEELHSQKMGTIEVAPGINQLQGIIDAADPGTAIVLLAGEHVEENTLVINHRVKLKGETGTTLSLGGVVGLMVIEANHVSVEDIHLSNLGTSLMGVGIENSNNFEMTENQISGFLISVVLEHSNRARIEENTVNGINPGGGLGIVNMNGNNSWIKDNSVSGNLFGIWLCDKRGLCTNNLMQNNTFGMILCKVGAGAIPFFSTGNGGSDFSGSQWWVRENESNNNVWGYIVIDGANHNFLADNTGSGNAFVDLELAGETVNLFGFPVPGSFNNTVRAGDLNYLDCGLDNRVYGGVESAFPCSD